MRLRTHLIRIMLPLAMASLGAVPGCSGDTGVLLVDLVTDYEPGTHFDEVVVNLGAAEETVDVDPAQDWSGGVRVAQLPLGNGVYTVVVIIRKAGEEFARSRSTITVSGSTGLRAVITRTCNGIQCGADTVCAGGQCVPEACPALGPELCPDPECLDDRGCAGSSECARGVCDSGVCLSVPTDSCDEGLLCDLEVGCRDPAIPRIPVLRFPWSGFKTGSLHADSTIASPPLRPRFIWESVDEAQHYELELSACRDPACDDLRAPLVFRSETADFRPSTPLAVRTSAPVGERYSFRVRACTEEGCSAFSTSRYVDVGRSSHDFNGDGYEDATFHSEDALGRVFVAYGRSDAASVTAPLEELMPPSAGVAGEARSAACAGDLDGDGFTDLVVGAALTGDSDSGAAFVHRGRGTGLDPEAVVITDPTAGVAWLGDECRALDDLDGDGYADLVLAAPMDGRPERLTGRVFQIRGAQYLDEGWASALPEPMFDPDMEAENRFGLNIGAPGDVNGDGYADLLIGSAWHTTRVSKEGRTRLFQGGPGGLTPTALTLSSPHDQTDSRFSKSPDFRGDLDGDGFFDIVLGTHGFDGEETDVGQAYVWFGRRASLLPAPDVALDPTVPDYQAFFGWSLWGADQNGDGRANICVSAIGTRTSARQGGAIYYVAFDDSRTGSSSLLLDPGAVAAGLFDVVGTLDFDGDGRDDVFGWASTRNPSVANQETVMVFFGAAPTADPSIAFTHPEGARGTKFTLSVH